MKVAVFKTDKVTSRSHDLFDLLDTALPVLVESSVVVVAAKIVSLCEGRTVPMNGADKDELIQRESQLFLARVHSKYHASFTITHNFLIPGAGIDESNADGHYILWPEDPQNSANKIRAYLKKKHTVTNIGVVISDSTSRAMQLGTTGVAIAYSGFVPHKSYAGTDDLFGRKMEFQKSNIASGLAAAAVLLMGEGSEQTPLAVVEDVPFVEFQDKDPTQKELDELRINPQDDLFWPIIGQAPWEKGQKPI